MKNALFALLFLSCLPISAQFSDAAPLGGVARLDMPAQDNDALYDHERAARAKQPLGRAPKFAVRLPVDVTPATHGTWESLPDGSQLWRLRVGSAGARSLNFGFSEFFMPTGGELWLSSPDGRERIGPFTPADNEAHEQLWTPVLYGEETVLVVKIPADRVGALQLRLTSVNHDFMGFGGRNDARSGSCNLDVVCDEDDGWGIVDNYRDIIQSVAVLSMGGTTFCTGFLIANTSGDCRPLFMTADHCGVNAGNAPSLVAIWNFQNSTCRQPNSPASGGNGDGVLTDFNSGAIFRAANGASDFCLVELDDPVSETADAFFAGWDANVAASDQAIAVHHPGTDEKRISFENDPTSINGNFIEVTDWDVGTTEGGSSGSPLFNGDKHVIGQLFGGGAACGNDLGDTYGAIFASYNGNAPSTRLRDWLDPENTGELVVDGYSIVQCSAISTLAVQDRVCAPEDLTYTINIGGAYTNPVTLAVTGLPAGTTADFAENPVAPNSSTTLTISGTANAPGGTSTLTITGAAGSQTFNATTVAIIDPDVPTVPAAQTPTNGATDVIPQPTYAWDAVPNASTYRVQVATDGAFDDVVGTAQVSTTSTFVTALDASSTYFWRVRAENSCGAGDWSATRMFTTGVCAQNVSADVPVSISPNGANTIFSDLDVPVGGIITDLNVVNVQGTHTWISDLTFVLESPAGTEVVLLAQACDDENNFNLSFDDAGGPILPCPYNDGGTYAPTGSLADFNGENAQGTWVLRVEDAFNFDGGALNGWGLEICSTPVFLGTVSTSPGSQVVCNTESAAYQVTIDNAFTDEVTITATSDPVGVLFDAGTTDPGGTLTLTADDLTTAGGVYTITFTATDGENTATSTAQLTVETGPTAATLTAPANEADNVPLNATFDWNGSSNTGAFTLEIANDIDFNDLVLTETSTGSSVTLGTNLNATTQYFWRITSDNDCGSATSGIRSFTTGTTTSVRDATALGLYVFPNPTTGALRVQLAQPLPSDGILRVLTVDGKQVYTQSLDRGGVDLQIALPDVAPGVYLLRLESATAIGTRRIGVQ